MSFNANIAMWIFSVMTVAVMESAAAARVLSASPMSLPDATTVTDSSSEDNLLQWLKIIAVPLGVFLVGASIWSCIKNSFPFWRRIFRPREHLSESAHARVEVQITEHANNSRQDGSDLENRTASPQQIHLGDGPVVNEQTVQTMQEPTIQSTNDAATPAAPQL